MDTVITGVGSIDNYGSLTRFMPTWLDADESRKVLAYCRDGSIVGDLGGYLVPAPETSDKIEQVKTFLNAINRRLIAATVDDFKAVAERHAKNPQSGAGVVCIAAGARKARILNALLAEQSCPVSRLFIDSHCALALLHLLDPARYSALRSTHGKQLLTGGDGWSKATKALIPVED
jgi:hypothetical protein